MYRLANLNNGCVQASQRKLIVRVEVAKSFPIRLNEEFGKKILFCLKEICENIINVYVFYVFCHSYVLNMLVQILNRFQALKLHVTMRVSGNVVWSEKEFFSGLNVENSRKQLLSEENEKTAVACGGKKIALREIKKNCCSKRR